MGKSKEISMLEDELLQTFDEEQLYLWEQLQELKESHPDYN